MLKFNNFPINAKFSQWGGSLHLHNIPRSSTYLKYVNFVYTVLIHLRKWDICVTYKSIHGENKPLIKSSRM